MEQKHRKRWASGRESSDRHRRSDAERTTLLANIRTSTSTLRHHLIVPIPAEPIHAPPHKRQPATIPVASIDIKRPPRRLKGPKSIKIKSAPNSQSQIRFQTQQPTATGDRISFASTYRASIGLEHRPTALCIPALHAQAAAACSTTSTPDAASCHSVSGGRPTDARPGLDRGLRRPVRASARLPTTITIITIIDMWPHP